MRFKPKKLREQLNIFNKYKATVNPNLVSIFNSTPGCPKQWRAREAVGQGGGRRACPRFKSETICKKVVRNVLDSVYRVKTIFSANRKEITFFVWKISKWFWTTDTYFWSVLIFFSFLYFQGWYTIHAAKHYWRISKLFLRIPEVVRGTSFPIHTVLANLKCPLF